MLDNLKKSFLSGLMISIGGAVYLSCSNKIAGAFLFALGLFTICVFGFNLFTGKIGYITDNKNKPDCLIIWLGNLLGCVVFGLMCRIANPELNETAHNLMLAKYEQAFYRTFIKAFFCGVLMFIAVDNFKNNIDSFGKYIGIFFCVAVFILCGFEHSIADMVYAVIAVRNVTEGLKSLLLLLLVTLGNAVGAISFRLLIKPALKIEK